MQPTIDFFEKLLTEHPDNPYVLYEVGGSYDTDGQEEKAIAYYERALPRLTGETRRKCLLQYGSTLRNLDRFDESLDVFKKACAEFPESDSLRVFKSLTLHAAGRRTRHSPRCCWSSPTGSTARRSSATRPPSAGTPTTSPTSDSRFSTHTRRRGAR